MDQSIITKADLIKPQKMKQKLLKKQEFNYLTSEEGKKLRNKIMAHNQGNLYVQDYTGVNPVVGNINSAQGAGTKMK